MQDHNGYARAYPAVLDLVKPGVTWLGIERFIRWDTTDVCERRRHGVTRNKPGAKAGKIHVLPQRREEIIARHLPAMAKKLARPQVPARFVRLSPELGQGDLVRIRGKGIRQSPRREVLVERRDPRRCHHDLLRRRVPRVPQLRRAHLRRDMRQCTGIHRARAGRAGADQEK